MSVSSRLHRIPTFQKEIESHRPRDVVNIAQLHLVVKLFCRAGFCIDCLLTDWPWKHSQDEVPGGSRQFALRCNRGDRRAAQEEEGWPRAVGGRREQVTAQGAGGRGQMSWALQRRSSISLLGKREDKPSEGNFLGKVITLGKDGIYSGRVSSPTDTNDRCKSTGRMKGGHRC